ncbi:GntR family transcriptional regulator [Falsigemmobacter faecalis]|uniref:GntR family transcriptional regulator n=1 Tax=Falsigemmobacter faecalis TaxID=2488730 RepID=A0A3P3DPL1_9RHOB|nr:GntR family transcriptional regulator [Falsigemmobacter faecalis]RRH76207.1 GntR family transcriptional regulator [Falsigemmobacter faecalis]
MPGACAAGPLRVKYPLGRPLITSVRQAAQSAGEQICGRLRGNILFGGLAPGLRLRLERLREEYEISVTTLREVLGRLTSEGLIRFEPQKGLEVARISATELRDIAEMRILPECHAAALSFAQGDPDREARVVAAPHKLTRMKARMLAGDHEATAAWKRGGRDFHVALILACDSAELPGVHARIFDRFLRYQMLLVMFRGAVAAAEHDARLQAALARDVAAAQKILTRHIPACIEYTLVHGLLLQSEGPLP